jgi:hypothetical protein
VKPKNTAFHWPFSVASVVGLPFWSTSWKGPPTREGGGALSKTPALKISPPATSTANRLARIANNR